MVITVGSVPDTYSWYWDDNFYGAKAVTVAEDKVLLQHYEFLYQLDCDTSNCAWSVHPKRLELGRKMAFTIILPPEFTWCFETSIEV